MSRQHGGSRVSRGLVLGALLSLLLGLPLLPAAAAVGETTWYFAEGYTGNGFDEYLTINNPGDTAGTAEITYYIEGQTNPTTRSVALPANSRTTVSVHSQADALYNPGGLGRMDAGHSTKVEADVPIVVERPMYFVYNGTIRGGHNVLGTNAPRGGWSMAEGFTGEGFDEYLTIQNPNSLAGLVQITYYVEGQTTPTVREVSLPANSRTTVPVHSPFHATNNPGGLGRLGGHSTRLLSTVPIVAERPMYFTYNETIMGGHNVMGAPDTCAVNMNGAQEAPTPVNTPGSGVVRLILNPTTGVVTGEWLITGLTSDITAAHIHEGAPGVAGPVRVPFSGLPPEGGAFTTTTNADPAVVAAIVANPTNYYVNVHTTTNSGGEIRGQLDSVVCTPDDD